MQRGLRPLVSRVLPGKERPGQAAARCLISRVCSVRLMRPFERGTGATGQRKSHSALGSALLSSEHAG